MSLLAYFEVIEPCIKCWPGKLGELGKMVWLGRLSRLKKFFTSRCAILNFIQVIHHPDSKLDEWYKLRLRFLYCQIKDSRAKISSFKKSLCFKHTYCANNMNEKYFITLKWPEGEFSKKWGFPIKVDFRPNLRKTIAHFPVEDQKLYFWNWF